MEQHAEADATPKQQLKWTQSGSSFGLTKRDLCSSEMLPHKAAGSSE